MSKNTKKIKYSKVIVIMCIVSILLYAVAGIILQCVTGVEISPTLTTCFFTFFGVELLSLAGIKKAKTKSVDYEVSYTDNVKYCAEDMANTEVEVVTETEEEVI